ncbi:MAG TPA: TRAM domain-containing protein, partial [Candidatus Binatus sp.]|nr:TRAM domain-containing protein [Candidatus Binatus sp.]
FDRVGVFTYSHEENTAAYNMPNQVPEWIKRARRSQLMATQSEISLKKNRALVGREVEVLVEGAMPGRSRRMRARTSGQAPEIDGSVFLAGDAEPGEFVRARIDKALSYDLHATVADAAA